MARQLVIGDIHGCFDELRALVDRVGLVEGDEIISVGDLVDRGPDSRRVLEFFQRTAGARAVMGNHERKTLAVHRGERPGSTVQLLTNEQFADVGLHHVCEYLAGFPRAIELPSAIVVHAFWEPGLDLSAQRDTVLMGTTTGEAHLVDSCAGQPWFERFDGPRPIVVGHRDYRKDGQPLIVDRRVFAIDTSCVFGGFLTGLLLPEFRMIQVRARKAYWTDARHPVPPRTIGVDLPRDSVAC